jgi:hypothetical protein
MSITFADSHASAENAHRRKLLSDLYAHIATSHSSNTVSKTTSEYNVSSSPRAQEAMYSCTEAVETW